MRDGRRGTNLSVEDLQHPVVPMGELNIKKGCEVTSSAGVLGKSTDVLATELARRH